MQDQKKILLDIQQRVELASENADLKKQFAIKELGWEQEKAKIMKALQAERCIKKQIQADKKALEKRMEQGVSSPSGPANKGCLAPPVLDQQTPSREPEDLFKTLSDIEKQVSEQKTLLDVQQEVELASENADLKKQFAIKELGWEQEKAKIMKALQAERCIKKQIQADKKALEKRMEQGVSSPSGPANKGCLAPPVLDQQTPSREPEDLFKTLSDIEKQVSEIKTLVDVQQEVELASENADLKKQFAIKELGWEQEKAKIMKALQTERCIRKQIQADKKALGKRMEQGVSSPSGPANKGCLAPPVLDQQSPSREPEDLFKTISDMEKQVSKLYLENAVLKEQMVTKEVSWEQEKAKIVKALQSERSIRTQAEADRKALEKQKEELTSFLCQTLLEEKNKFNSAIESLIVIAQNEKYKENWIKENNITFSMNKVDIVNLDSTWEKRWLVREEEHSARIKTLQDDFDRKKSQITPEKDHLITNETSEKKSLEEQNWSEAKQKWQESEMILVEAEWKLKLTALEDQMRHEFSAKEARELDLQRLSKEASEKEITDIKCTLEMKEKEIETIRSEAERKIKSATLDQQRQTHALQEEHYRRGQESARLSREMEKELRLKVNQLEANIWHLTQQNDNLHNWNIHLQALSQKTDKEKAQMRKEEEKLEKEREKMLKKQMKERQEAENDLLKRQNKACEEKEKREKAELKKQKKGR
uniref:calponin homology domain-containing protein DDB_G0272472-like n=1 Tax=Gasterosteus aculeatus aculeatus TaxID=481459 RepID=UPI001A99C744|nr:calponin homology domain-containing protein DDB_G0272472-like [Gasterosteus aculeatus aculeatus]XP_040043693.1 calponin homology domain-containing protein DDB_G0272472-like [Gasterosteus aculeatus aculeatus]